MKVVRLEFPNGFDERAAFEAEQRGYYGNARVVLENGLSYDVSFFEPAVLLEEIRSDLARGKPCFAENGLIVVSSVTRSNMESSAQALAEWGYFDTMTPAATSQ